MSLQVTLLLHAAAWGKKRIVQVLIDKGADVAQTDIQVGAWAFMRTSDVLVIVVPSVAITSPLASEHAKSSSDLLPKNHLCAGS